MSLIFFDLETSDKSPCAQILNYSFIRTSDNFEFQDELSGEIALSILQIPSPGALLTNRIRIIDHQAENFPQEPEALLGIARFIAESIEIERGPITLVGYNSTKFDLPFLRTSFIRNGINPYFAGKIVYQDLLHIMRKAFILRLDFPLSTKGEDKNTLSHSLEACSKAHDLLDGQQTHHSREDVLLTIKLARKVFELYGLHPRNFKSYEPPSGINLAGYVSPNYELQAKPYSRAIIKPYGLISENYRAALWIDLDRYKGGEGSKAISYFNKNTAQFILDQSPLNLSHNDIYNQAKSEFAKLTPDSFFTKSSCDIEQDIYRLDIQKISVLSQVIWKNERALLKEIKDKDLQDLINRYWLAYGGNKNSDKWKDKLSEYLNYRYKSGKFQLSKMISEKSETDFHPTLSDWLTEIDKLNVENQNDNEKREILKQLREFIKEHPVSSPQYS